MRFTKRFNDIAEKYYDQDTLNHAVRVARNVYESSVIKLYNPTNFEYQLLVDAALLHDILEDTQYGFDEDEWKDDPYGLQVFEIVNCLTKPRYEKYDSYIRKVSNEVYDYKGNGKYAYMVKIADMMDHLKQKETLTDKLKEKYLVALPYLL